MEAMAVLADAKLVGTGMTLVRPCQQSGGWTASAAAGTTAEAAAGTAAATYVDNVSHPCGYPSLLFCIAICFSRAPGIAQLLVYAGADTASAVPVTNPGGAVVFNRTPLAFTEMLLYNKDAEWDGNPLPEDKRHTLEAVRRLLLREEVVRARSRLRHHCCCGGGGGCCCCSRARWRARFRRPPRRLRRRERR